VLVFFPNAFNFHLLWILPILVHVDAMDELHFKNMFPCTIRRIQQCIFLRRVSAFCKTKFHYLLLLLSTLRFARLKIENLLEKWHFTKFFSGKKCFLGQVCQKCDLKYILDKFIDWRFAMMC
jgi:hypothetical protein